MVPTPPSPNSSPSTSPVPEPALWLTTTASPCSVPEISPLSPQPSSVPTERVVRERLQTALSGSTEIDETSLPSMSASSVSPAPVVREILDNSRSPSPLSEIRQRSTEKCVEEMPHDVLNNSKPFLTPVMTSCHKPTPRVERTTVNSQELSSTMLTTTLPTKTVEHVTKIPRKSVPSNERMPIIVETASKPRIQTETVPSQSSVLSSESVEISSFSGECSVKPLDQLSNQPVSDHLNPTPSAQKLPISLVLRDRLISSETSTKEKSTEFTSPPHHSLMSPEQIGVSSDLVMSLPCNSSTSTAPKLDTVYSPHVAPELSSSDVTQPSSYVIPSTSANILSKSQNAQSPSYMSSTQIQLKSTLIPSSNMTVKATDTVTMPSRSCQVELTQNCQCGSSVLLPTMPQCVHAQISSRLPSKPSTRQSPVISKESSSSGQTSSFETATTTDDEKQIDFAEQVESVAYVLCGEQDIDLPKFCQIFQAKGVVDKLFRLVDQDSDGVVTPDQVMDFLANITNSRPRAGFDKGSLEWLEQLFRQTVGDEREIRRDDFKKIVISKNPFFTERVFQIFDKDNSGSISLQEFIDAMHQFAGQSPDDKIKFLFKVYDLDGDGLIQHRELQHVMRACMEENGMKFSEDQIDDLTMALFEDADADNRGAITYEALKNQLQKHGGLLENLSISIDRWLVPPKPKAAPRSLFGKLAALRPYQLSRPYMKNNYVYLIFLAVFTVVNIGLFISRAIEYREHGGFVMLARACGQCLNFNCMFVLVLMLRQCITFLRTRGFSMFLPLDQHIYFHKLTGVLIFVYSVVHTIMHLCNFSITVVNDPIKNSANYTLSEWLLTSRPGLFGLVPGCANPTGVALIVILSVMFICSQPFVRRGGCFEIFYWTHLLYIPFWILVIFHAPNFWKWFIFPGCVYIVERVIRLVWMRSERGKTYISSGLLLPSKVTHLVIKRPHHFDFHPGDYVFVNIPAIAKYEWHPFTISSAPEQEDYMWLHIRGVGEWTNRLYSYFEREQEKLHNVEETLAVNLVTKALTNGAGAAENPKSIKKIQASIKKKFENNSDNSNSKVKALAFRKGEGGYINESFTSDSDINLNSPMQHSSEGDLSLVATGGLNNVPPRKLTPDRKLQMLLLNKKTPLSKSLSMPDMQTRVKKRERLIALREYMRSESEKSFDECQMRRARLQSLGLAYLSPQNKSLAQSFRYMRTKPTIIAFKTPSLEECEARASAAQLSLAGIIRRRSSGSQASTALGTSPGGGDTNPESGVGAAGSAERAAEEGRAGIVLGSLPSSSGLEVKLNTPVNYPVGKPLETISEEHIIEVTNIPLEEGTEIYLDGPYGAPSSHIFRAQHAVLIATGIGVTPFASILQSIMHRYWKARHCCPKCKFSWASDIPPTVMNLRKVDFFWINRDQRSFEWFVNLLSQLEIEQAELGGAMERFLEMHMYITSALQKTDMKAVGLQLALDLLHEKEKRDLITGLKTRTNAGRPNWDKVFKQLLDQKKGKVTVFYCGPPQLGRILRVKCDQFGFNFRKEVF